MCEADCRGGEVLRFMENTQTYAEAALVNCEHTHNSMYIRTRKRFELRVNPPAIAHPDVHGNGLS